MLTMKRPAINKSNDDNHYKTLVEIQTKADKDYGTCRNYNSIPMGSTSNREWRTMDPVDNSRKGRFKTIMTTHTKYA